MKTLQDYATSAQELQAQETKRHARLQTSLVEQTYINYSTIPEEIQESYYPHFLLWKPKVQAQPNNTPSKIIKPPLYGSGWQLPINLKSYHEILDNYQDYHKSHDIFSLSLTTLNNQDQDSNNQDLDTLIQTHINSIQNINPKNPPIGIGFAYNADHPFVCIDIDAASESNNELLDLLPSYTEWSPSSDGLHIIVQLPTAKDKQTLIDAGFKTKYDKGEDRDLFISSGYVTLTGRLTNMPNRDKVKVFPVQQLIDILSQFFQAKVHAIPTPLMQETQETQKTKKPKSKKPVSAVQVQKYLDEIPVIQLYSTIFDDLHDNKHAILNPKCVEEAYTPWLIIGQAIHHNFSQFPMNPVEGYKLWNDWSQLGNKYNQEDLDSKWRSFGKQDQPTENQVTIGALIKLFKAQQPQFPIINERGVVAANFLNLATYLDFYKFVTRLNVISNQIEMIVPENRVSAWNAPAINKMDLKTQVIFMKDNFKSIGYGQRNYNTDDIAAYLCTSATENHYNPIKEYFEESGKNWDGQDRLPQLYSSISLVEEKDTIKVSVYEFIRRWLIQVVASACRSEHSNTETIQQFSTVLIFIGSQGIGKTRWAQSLFPKTLHDYCLGNKELHLNTSGNEYTKLVMEIMSTVICNINEIDTHFTAKSYSKFKSFLDTDTFKLVLPYGKKDEILVKRTSFIGSTNQDRFLVDPTGNRRIEIIKCNELNPAHEIDLDQLWGQIHNMYISREKWWFNPKDPKDIPHIQVRDNLNSQAMTIQDNWYLEVLKEAFDFSEPRGTWDRQRWDRANINKALCEHDPRLGDRYSRRNFKEQLNTLKTYLTGLSYGHPISYNSGTTGARTYYYLPHKKVRTFTQDMSEEKQKPGPKPKKATVQEQQDADFKKLYQ